MRYLRLYKNDSDFKAQEHEAGGTGNDIESIVPGIVKTLDERKMYFNPHDKEIHFHTSTVNYKDSYGNIIADNGTLRAKYISGVTQEIVVTPKSVENYVSKDNKKTVVVPDENVVDFVYDYDLAAPMTFEIISGGTLYWRKDSGASEKEISYRINDGRWQKITSSDAGVPINVNAGDTVQIKGDNSYYAQYSSTNYFSCSNGLKFNVKGNIMSLISSTEYSTLKAMPLPYSNYQFAFVGLFKGCNGLISAQKLALPATTLATSCYTMMFSNCTSLTTAPVALPATTLQRSCYYGMFSGCINLTTAPELPASTLTSYCYSHMFEGCTSLVKAPTLPALYLSNSYAYYYYAMFSGCTNLNYVECLATGMSNTYSYSTNFWLDGVSDFGVFLKNPDVTEKGWGRGVSGIPYNWVVGNYGDTIVLEKSELAMFESGGNKTLKVVELASAWTVTNDNDWIILDVVSGDSGVTTITVNTVSTNKTRTGKVIFSDGITTKELSIVQNDFEAFKASPFTLKVISGGTIFLRTTNTSTKVTVKYRKNNSDWVTITSNTGASAPSILVNDGDVLEFIGDNAFYGASSAYNNFSASTGTKFEAQGNIISLLDSIGFATATGFSRNYAFRCLFYGCSGLTSAENLILPAKVTSFCYWDMFRGCTSLTIAPKLPASALTDTCYGGMFSGCTSLNYINCLAVSSYSNSTSNWVCNVAPSGTFVQNAAATAWTVGNNGIPSGWVVKYEESTLPLTFRIMNSGNIIWKASPGNTSGATIQYKLNGGDWTNISGTTAGTAISVVSGDTVYFRGNNNAYGNVSYKYHTFSSSTARFEAKGNIMSLVYSTTYTTATTLSAGGYNFYGLFSNCTALTSAEKLILPPATLTQSCYECMFSGCTNLTTAPELPATTLGRNCYYGMFAGCANLTAAPELPVNTLADGCYTAMFRSCTSLVTAPSLPATSLTKSCYGSMFHGCTSLATIPELPATTLGEFCYSAMFEGCTSLTTAPVILPAATLMQYCYSSMFRGCTSLTSAPELPATTLANSCYNMMFQRCTNLITAPDLPAATLADGCYYDMFAGCSSLATAPELPATTLARRCYYDMFYGCTSLTTAPLLPATTLASECYEYMFQGCTGLTAVPGLPATTLVERCYDNMFSGCTNLNYIKCLATDISATNCTRDWVIGVQTNSGTFVKPTTTDWSSKTGNDGIPANWTVQNI